mgnify:FL=1
MAIRTQEKVGTVEDIDKLKKILVYLIGHLEGTKYKTELIKLSFILDYRYCKEFRSEDNATSVEYIKYNYGPYSDSFVEAFEQLKSEGLIVEVSLPFGVGFTLADSIKNQELDQKVKEIVDKVIQDYGKKSLREMKAFIYDLEEFKNTEFGKAIKIN